MKVALLSALAYKPQLLVLDEPFAGLDGWVREELIKGVLELAEQDHWSVLVSSQDIDEVEQLADQIGVLDEGELILCESTEYLLHRFRRVEVTTAQITKWPENMRPSWILPESTGHRFSFLCTDYKEGTTEEELRALFPAATHIGSTKVDLQQITVALGRSAAGRRAGGVSCD